MAETTEYKKVTKTPLEKPCVVVFQNSDGIVSVTIQTPCPWDVFLTKEHAMNVMRNIVENPDQNCVSFSIPTGGGL